MLETMQAISMALHPNTQQIYTKMVQAGYAADDVARICAAIDEELGQ
jgi:hypothetical protein